MSATYPYATAEVRGGGGVLFQVRLECRDYDYEPPEAEYLFDSGDPIPWTRMTWLGRKYLHVGPIIRGMYSDIVALSPSGGFVCVEGIRGYHRAHPAQSWFDVRLTLGRLYSLFENVALAVDIRRARASL